MRRKASWVNGVAVPGRVCGYSYATQGTLANLRSAGILGKRAKKTCISPLKCSIKLGFLSAYTHCLML